jgi:hypothetical protein
MGSTEGKIDELMARLKAPCDPEEFIKLEFELAQLLAEKREFMTESGDPKETESGGDGNGDGN